MNKDEILSFDSDKDRLDHGASKESMNPIGAKCNFITSFDVPWSEWSWIIDADMDHHKGTHG